MYIYMLVVQRAWDCMVVSDCEFDHVIHTLSDAKFHGEADSIYCGVIGAIILELWIIK